MKIAHSLFAWRINACLDINVCAAAYQYARQCQNRGDKHYERDAHASMHCFKVLLMEREYFTLLSPRARPRTSKGFARYDVFEILSFTKRNNCLLYERTIFEYEN